MSKKDSKSLSDAIVKLKNTEKVLLNLSMDMYSADDGKIFPIDLVAIGAIKRTISNRAGFITLIEAKNMTSARSLLRIQIDTFMRFSAIWLVDSPHDFATEFINGKHIRNIKDNTGSKMTDRYLADTLSKEYPWVKEVYENLSGNIHFSSQHLFDAVSEIDNKAEAYNIVLGKEDTKFPEHSWIEIVDCFTDSVNIFSHYLRGWIKQKTND